MAWNTSLLCFPPLGNMSLEEDSSLDQFKVRKSFVAIIILSCRFQIGYAKKFTLQT